MKKIIVAYNSMQYPEKRNIIFKLKDVDYRFIRGGYALLRRICKIPYLSYVFKRQLTDSEFKYMDIGVPKYDVIHFFNTISYSRKPWVLTFETLIPRFKVALQNRESNVEKLLTDPETIKALEAISSDSCLAIIAISNSAKILQENFLDLFPKYKSTILKKIIVIHPPQEIYDGKNIPRNVLLKKTINATLVGHHFFRKGGREILNVLQEINSKDGVKVKLTIVSKLYPDSYASLTKEDDVLAVQKFIKKNSEWIEYYEILESGRVHEIMEDTDIGLLPSYAETYGYSVFEFQAHGVPVITTDIRSFPEINNDQIGWIIPVTKRNDGEACYNEAGGRERISREIEIGLMNAMEEILKNREALLDKGSKARKRIKMEHNEELYAKKLREVYKKHW